jgi:hypothetical protein
MYMKYFNCSKICLLWFYIGLPLTKQNALKKKIKLNKPVIIYHMNVQIFVKSVIIWVWGKLTQVVDGESEKTNNFYWAHVKVQPIGNTPSYSLHDWGDGVILQVQRETCRTLTSHHLHCLLVQMVWDTSVHKVQPCHLVYAVECDINGRAVLQVKLKTAVFNVTNFQAQWEWFSTTHFNFIHAFTHCIYRNRTNSLIHSLIIQKSIPGTEPSEYRTCHNMCRSQIYI